MAQHVWTVLCNKAIVDERTKQVSLLEITEQINFSGEIPPQELIDKGVNIPVPLNLVSFLTRTDKDAPETVSMRIRLVGPNNRDFKATVVPINLESTRNARQIISVETLPFSGFGEYYFLVELNENKSKEDWEEAVRVPFTIVNQNEKTLLTE